MSNVCEVCGATSSDTGSWIISCPIHFGDVCMTCCWNCKYMNKISSLVYCDFMNKDRANGNAGRCNGPRSRENKY